jgi:hypothetical protein
MPELVQINPLANPKGIEHGCELCGRAAHIQCGQCKVTYYWCELKHDYQIHIAVTATINRWIGRESMKRFA